jgi:deoxyribodipyrimidine photo-lyase
MVPALRITAINQSPLRTSGDYVLYWMIASRRPCWNFALERAVEYAIALRKPLLVLEALRVNYRWASLRFHQFVVDGMRDNARAFARAGVTYYPFIERQRDEGSGLLEGFAARAAAVVTDDFPCFFLPRMVAAAGARLDVLLEAVDSNGLLPMRAAGRVYPTAVGFRRALQAALPSALADRPARDPLAGLPAGLATIDDAARARWPHALDWLDGGGTLHALPIDLQVRAVDAAGGHGAASERLEVFLAEDFGAERNDPDHERSSRLSGYLHWGHVAVHEVFDALMTREGWLGDLPQKGNGAREGWWGVSPAAERFLDELVTWRELGFNFTSKRDGYDVFESLPLWAQHTLEAHESDDREFLYDASEFEQARTHDPLWNAAQRQLVIEGRIHNYLRMLWGKKILEWSATPREALATMIALNNKYALDGRDPSSYSGIFWVLGRYDRPWHPERPVFGSVRYMSSANTAKKMRVKQYVTRYSRLRS